MLKQAGERKRSRSELAILAATRELLAEGGVHKLTVEGVAARSGVAKTTIYRRFPGGKRELALAVLIDMVETVAAVPDLGDTRRELTAFVDATLHVLGSTLMGRVMQGLVSDLANDPQLAAEFRERVVELRVGEVRRMVERGIERGDLRPDTDVGIAHELLFGPVYYRLLLGAAPLDKRLAPLLVDAVLKAFARNT